MMTGDNLGTAQRISAGLGIETVLADVKPGDKSALKKWDEYSIARNEMFSRTHTASSPWTILRADDKHLTRVNLIRDLLNRFEFEGKDRRADLVDPAIVFTFNEEHLRDGQLAE